MFLERSPFGWHHLPLMEDLSRSILCLYCIVQSGAKSCLIFVTLSFYVFAQAGNQFWFPDDVTMGFLVEHELGVSWLCFSLVCNYFQCLGSSHRPLRVPLPPRADGRHQAGGAAHPGEDHDGSDSVTQSWSCIDNFLLKLFTTLNHKVSFSYLLEGQTPNVVQIEGPFPPSIDPTRYVATIYGTKMFDLLQL